MSFHTCIREQSRAIFRIRRDEGIARIYGRNI
jgi:hypothetical protein